jgi:hypothetical protein
MGMFDPIIKRIEKYEKVSFFKNLLLLLIRVKVESAKSNGHFPMKVLMLEERLKQKRL